MDRTGVDEDVQFLTGSCHRAEILRVLCTAPYRPTDLCDRVDVTRTTVQRVLAGFLDRQWVVKSDGRYRATLTGQRVLDRLDELHEEIERARELGPLAAHVGQLGDALPETALTEGDVTATAEQGPLAVVDEFVEWFEAGAGGHVRALSPVVARTFNDVAAELLEADTTIDLVIDRTALEQSTEAFPAATRRGVEDDNVDVFVSPERLSTGLAVRPASTCLVVYDDDSSPKAMLQSEDESVRDWAVDYYRRVEAQAEPLAKVL